MRTRLSLATAAFAVLGHALSVAPARAVDTGCASLLWPVAKERAAFARPDLPVVVSGAALGTWREQAFALELKPQAEAALPMPPSGQPMTKVAKPFAAMASFAAPSKAGVYHVTLSRPAWIDVVQGGVLLPAAAHTGAHDCRDVHKSVRFELGVAPLVLEISGAGAGTIKVGIVPAVD